MADDDVTTMAEDVEAILGEGGVGVAEHLEGLVEEGLETRSMVCMTDESNGDPDEVASDTDEPDVVGEPEVAVSDEEDTEEGDTPVEAAPILDSATDDAPAPAVSDTAPEDDVEEPLPAEPVVTPEEPMVVESDVVGDEPGAEPGVEGIAEDPDEHQDGTEPVLEAATQAAQPVDADGLVTESCGCSPPGSAVVVVAPLGGATTFEGAMGFHEARKEAWRLSDGWHLLTTVMDNIMEDTDAENKAAMIEVAVKQFLAFVKSDLEVYSEAADEGVAPVEEGTPTESAQPVEASVVKEVPVTEADTVSDEEQAIADRLQALAATGIPDESVSGEATPTAVVEPPPVGTGVIDVSAGDEVVVPPSYQTASTFGAALEALQVKAPRPMQRMSRDPSAVQQPGIAPVATEEVTDLRSLVQSEIQVAVTPVLEEIVAQLQALSAGVPAVNEDVARPVRRRSQSQTVAAPRIVTQAATFGDVVDRLGENRNRLLRGR